jgi:hypothetical protein
MVQLAAWVRSINSEFAMHDRDYKRVMKEYTQLEAGADKLQRILYMLERVGIYMLAGDKTQREEFENQLRDAKSSEETTIGDLKQLFVSGATNALKSLTNARDERLAVFNAVISGEAATYTTPTSDAAE